MLTEKIKRDRNRVDIATLKPDEITAAQKQYLQDFVFTCEQVLHSDGYDDPLRGYPAFLDVASFRDYFILSEVSRNVADLRSGLYLVHLYLTGGERVSGK